MKILLVEDERTIALIAVRLLRETGAEVTWLADGMKGYEAALAGGFDLIVLDILLPTKNGRQICADLRQNGVTTPIMMLSALDEVGDRVQGFGAGADDYLPKPFEAEELIARAAALLRRSPTVQPDTIRVADLELDRKHRMAYRSGMMLGLTETEFDVLESLASQEGRIVPSETIAQQAGLTLVTGESADAVIDGLRSKVDFNFHPKLLHAVPGFGYLMQPRMGA